MQALRRIAVVLVALALFPVGTLVLHFTQKRHNVLPFDVEHAFRPEHPIVGESRSPPPWQSWSVTSSRARRWRPNDFFLWGPGLEADTRLRNDERKFWFPSAESAFSAGTLGVCAPALIPRYRRPKETRAAPRWQRLHSKGAPSGDDEVIRGKMTP